MKKTTLTLLAALMMLLMSHPLKAQTPTFVPFSSAVSCLQLPFVEDQSIVRVWNEAYAIIYDDGYLQLPNTVSLVDINIPTLDNQDRYFNLPMGYKINDIRTTCDNSAYCCGSTPTGEAFIGCLKVNDILDSIVNVRYVVLSDLSLKSLHKLAVYDDDATGTHYLAAIGVTASGVPCVLEANRDLLLTSSLTYDICEFSNREEFNEIVVTKNYIVAIGSYDTGSDTDVCLRWYKKGQFADPVYWKEIYYPNIEIERSKPLGATFLEAEQIAVAQVVRNRRYLYTFDLASNMMINNLEGGVCPINVIPAIVYVPLTKKVVFSWINGSIGYLIEVDPWGVGAVSANCYNRMQMTYIPSLDLSYGRRIIGQSNKYCFALDMLSPMNPPACFTQVSDAFLSIGVVSPMPLSPVSLWNGVDNVNSISFPVYEEYITPYCN